MKSNKIAILALALAATMPLVAQKNPTMKGSITYVVEIGKPQPAAPAASMKNGRKTELSVSAQAMVAAPSDMRMGATKPSEAEGIKKEAVYAFDEENCYALLPNMFYHYNSKDGLITQGVHAADPVYRTATYKKCSLRLFDCELLNQVADMQRLGADQEAQDLLNKYYKRTDEEKEIAGVRVVRYEMMFAKGSLWVAEDLWLDTWMAPFWGMNHPVLECDLPPLAEGCEDVIIHLTASKIFDNEQLLKPGVVTEREEVTLDDVIETTHQLVEILRK